MNEVEDENDETIINEKLCSCLASCWWAGGARGKMVGEIIINNYN